MDDKKSMPPDRKEEGEQTALLPKSILMGKEFKVGDEVVLEITAIHDEEIAVKYAKEPEHDEEPAKAKAPEMGESGDGEMASMME